MIEPMICRTRGEHANHYATVVVFQLSGIMPYQLVDITFKKFADNRINGISILNNFQASALLCFFLFFFQNSIFCVCTKCIFINVKINNI